MSSSKSSSRPSRDSLPNAKKRSRESSVDSSTSRPSKKKSSNDSAMGEQVFIEFSADGKSIGLILLSLFDYAAPDAVKKFRLLLNESNENNSQYRNTKIHRIIPNFILQGGEFDNKDKEIESFDPRVLPGRRARRHLHLGSVSLLMDEQKKVNSKFLITLNSEPMPWMDKKHVVVGQVIEGLSTLKLIEQFGSVNGSVKSEIIIIDCGNINKEILSRLENEKISRRDLSESRAQHRANNPVQCEKCSSPMKYNKRTRKGLRYRCKNKECLHAQYVQATEAATPVTEEK